MAEPFIIIDCLDDWAPYYPTACAITAEEFLRQNSIDRKGRVVFNLCGDMEYLSPGYYCSLLAEARGAKVMPSVQAINDILNFGHYSLLRVNLPLSDRVAVPQFEAEAGKDPAFHVFFGKCCQPEFQPLARAFFDQYMAPILRIQLRSDLPRAVESVRLGRLSDLGDAEQTLFAETLDIFSRKIWPMPRKGKAYRYDLAILHNPDEKLPPSNPKALKRFVRAGQDLGLHVELITAEDFNRLAEFDALFIRETTAVTDHTYRFAKRAEREGLALIDTPAAILRCTNKIFLTELLETNRIQTPRSRLLLRSDHTPAAEILESLGSPIILKVPDGSFSIGVEKARDEAELNAALDRLFERSSMLLAQEYVPTEFDWRIGVLSGRPFYACKYFMARGHWQIYNHDAFRHRYGAAETVGIPRVPKPVIQAASRACRLIGDGLFGVDIKEWRGKAIVIEVNDNPSIDADVEDEHLGEEIYRIIMSDFLRRLDETRR